MVADVLVKTNESSITNENSVFAPAAAVANNTFQSLPLFNAVVVICKIAVGAEDCTVYKNSVKRCPGKLKLSVYP